MEMDRNYPALKYFKLDEFDCPTDKGSGENMCPIFVRKLDKARELAGIPFRINSGYRTPAHNKEVGGVKNSSHMNIPCNASDIHIKDSRSRFLILVALKIQGFTRFGIGKNFIHVDSDDKNNGGDKSPNVIWQYY
tara:strand:- start:675 stop:1079 length:405 start_codon:yes stop_codon:yes gene_type:complete